ncbi:MAG: protocatechuate 3,4-dioxygenase subunit beta [Acidimicrobiales bacterium]
MRTLDPPYDYPGYRSTGLRHPLRDLLVLPPSEADGTGPVFGHGAVGPDDHDLTVGHAGEPQGQRIVLEGRLVDRRGRPVAGQLVELWQANAAGRYRHDGDGHPAPLDSNFTGYGRCRTGDHGWYRFVTVRPGAYPWGNHHNAWRPAHIHLSVFGRAFTDRLVTQVYFPGTPLLHHDPIYQSVSPAARGRLVSRLDLARSVPEWALCHRFDIVVAGPSATPTEPPPYRPGGTR